MGSEIQSHSPEAVSGMPGRALRLLLMWPAHGLERGHQLRLSLWSLCRMLIKAFPGNQCAWKPLAPIQLFCPHWAALGQLLDQGPPASFISLSVSQKLKFYFGFILWNLSISQGGCWRGKKKKASGHITA